MEKPTNRTIRNESEWKSNNYGIKETTLIQTGMRGRVGRMGWSHIYVWWIKIQEGYLRSEENPGPHQDPNPGFQDQEDKFL